MEIEIPFIRETKNFWVHELKNGVYIITIYLPKAEHEKTDNVKVMV